MKPIPKLGHWPGDTSDKALLRSISKYFRKEGGIAKCELCGNKAPQNQTFFIDRHLSKCPQFQSMATDMQKMLVQERYDKRKKVDSAAKRARRERSGETHRNAAMMQRVAEPGMHDHLLAQDRVGRATMHVNDDSTGGAIAVEEKEKTSTSNQLRAGQVERVHALLHDLVKHGELNPKLLMTPQWRAIMEIVAPEYDMWMIYQLPL